MEPQIEALECVKRIYALEHELLEGPYGHVGCPVCLSAAGIGMQPRREGDVVVEEGNQDAC